MSNLLKQLPVAVAKEKQQEEELCRLLMPHMPFPRSLLEPGPALPCLQLFLLEIHWLMTSPIHHIIQIMQQLLLLMNMALVTQIQQEEGGQPQQGKDNQRICNHQWGQKDSNGWVAEGEPNGVEFKTQCLQRHWQEAEEVGRSDPGAGPLTRWIQRWHPLAAMVPVLVWHSCEAWQKIKEGCWCWC